MESTSGNIKRILIIGGGVAGWMAAAYLNRLRPGIDLTITLVESVKLDTSSVGEPSHPALVSYLRSLGINEAQFMQQTSAAFQLGSRFRDWREDGQDWWHPFGPCGGTINNIDLFHFWLKGVRTGGEHQPYSSYALQALLAENGQAPRSTQGSSPIIDRGDYAYQLDPAAFTDLLRERSTAEDVNQIFDDVRNVVLNASGAIERVETRSGRSLSADLYVDCTDEGLLIERALGDPWTSWSGSFLCDRAIVLPLPRDSTMPPYIGIAALSAGWMRHVVLSHRVACTYFYSGGHQSDDAALRELLGRASPNKACAAEPRRLKLRYGRRQTFWRRNCLALGSAAGVIDPLQSTDVLLVQRGLELLISLFPDSQCNETLSRAFNQRLTGLCDAVRDFVLLHYLLSRRGEPFWAESRSVPVPEALQALLELHDENGYVTPELTSIFPEPSYHHIFAGGGRLPRRPCTAADALDFGKVQGIMQQMQAQNAEWIAKLPPHRELMERLHRPPV